MRRASGRLYKLLKYIVVLTIGLLIAFFLFLIYLFVTQANIEQVSYLEGCYSEEKMSVYCGFQNPEDLSKLPDERHILVSEFGAIIPLSPENIPGYLSLLDTFDGSKKQLDITMGLNDWGNPDCKRDGMTFSPHGIDVNQRLDGRYQLAVVNHMPNESIEMFELIQSKDNWSLIWRGCVLAPDHGYFNDVALKSDGSLYVSQMYDKESSLFQLAIFDSTKIDTGYVYYWEKNKNFQKLKNTDGAFPNGVELSQDERSLFINYAFGNKTSKYSLITQEIEYSIDIDGIPDNITIDDQYLWIGAQDNSGLDSLIYCGVFAEKVFDNPNIKQCPLPFAGYQLKQSDLTLVNTYAYSDTVMGTATVALPMNGKLYFGTYHGDRIASVDLKKE